MSRWQLFWAVAAMATAPLFAETTPAYPFRYSTLDRVGELAVQPTSEANDLSFKLNAETFDKAIGLVAAGGPAGETVTEWRPVAFVPPEVTVTAISVAIPGTDAPASITVTPKDGDQATFKLAPATETVSLVGADGSTATATLRTYVSDAGVTLAPDQACGFVFDDTQSGTAIRNFYTFGGAPHLRVTGTASITRHVITIDDGEQHSFNTLLGEQTTGYQDEANHVIVVEFSGSGGTLEMDAPLQNAPLVIGSSVSSTEAATEAAVSFDSDFAVPLSLRDGEGGKGGLSLTFGTNASFNPSALLLACDVTLKSPVYLPEGAWLAKHAVPIPAGRTFRLELDQPVGSENNLPNLSFADATSRLELASDAASPEDNPLGIPSKYQTMLCTQSGTLVFDRNVSANSFALSDWRASNGPSADRPLETHVVLRDGHTYDFGSMLGFMSLGTPIGKATLTVEGGTVEVSTLNLTATDATLDIQGGTVKAGGLAGIDSGTHTAITVAKGATLSLDREFADGAPGSTATLDVAVAGTLSLLGDVHMRPALRRTLRLEGGTLEARSALKIFCDDGGASTAEDYLVVSGGGTLSGPLTVDSLTGEGLLTIGQGAKVTTLYAYNGTIEGTGDVDAFTGDLGDVTLGGDWLTGAGKTLSDVVDKAQNYHGTLGFTAGTEGAPKTIDFASVAKLTELPGAFRVNDYQNITMRLDQYIDATVRWPSPATGVTLTLIESGAYGGEAEIPAVPAGVTFAFQYYNDEGELKDRLTTDYQRVPSEDGVSDELTWENAVFTGQGAWIDIEFNGDTKNTGWFTLGDYEGNPVNTPDQRNRYNGLLAGDVPYVVLEQNPTTTPTITTSHQADFTASSHPYAEFGSLPLHYRPYVALASLEYPEAWTVSLRLSAPDAARTCILALGHNYTGTTAGIPKYEGDVYSLIFATGETANEICLWVVPGLEGEGVSGTVARPKAPAFTVTLADATTAQHTFSVICDGKTMNLYVDGAWLGEHTLPGGHLSNGLQVGVQLGGSSIPVNLETGFADAVGVEDGGSIDFLRFYKGAMPSSAMVEIADRTPYVRENLRYVRYVPITSAPDGFTKTVPAGGETWIQSGAWREETWDAEKQQWNPGDYADQPAEGAECRILVAAGEHALQVNVERQVTGETDGDGLAVPAEHYFYSPNRTYASLVVRAQDAADSAATLRLVPLGVTEKETADTETDTTRPWESQLTGSDWFKVPEESTPGNRTGFRYGTLRFTGGANDPINDEGRIPNFYGAGYLLSGGATSASGEGAVIEEGEIVQDGGVQYGGGTYYYRYRQEVKVRYATTGAIPMVGIYDAGVCYLSRHANTVLAASADQIQTVEREWRQPLVYENGTYTANGERYIHRTTLLSTSDDTTVGAQLNTLEMVAGLSLTRGVMDEVARWQLTGPVVVQGKTEAGRDYVLGHAGLPKDQASEDVWVPFFGADSTWKFYDDTRVEGGDGNGNGAKLGLFARGVQTPGRLYLDFTATNGLTKYKAGHNFSQQAWYRYNYEGETEEGPTGEQAQEANADDFAQAVAFQIRLCRDAADSVTLTLDKVPKARVQTFYVEEAAETEGGPLTLALETKDGVGPLAVWQRVIAAARLDVSNHGKGNALNLRPEGPTSARRTPIHRGNSTRGAYVVGNATGDWDFGAESSVPRLEVAKDCELTFTVGQDLRRYGTVVAAQEGAWIHHKCDAPFLGQDVELAEGATFGFHASAAASTAREEGVVLAGRLVLHGTATLRAEGGSGNRLPRFYAAGGIVAEPLASAESEEGQSGAIELIVDAAKADANWRSRTAALTGDVPFGLRKTGPGIVTFDTDVPPSVSGLVSVDAGTLNVTAAADTPVGKQGLHVKAGATLGDSGRMVGEGRLLAAIPAGQTLSGGGTVAGPLGLQPGATYRAKKGEFLTVTGGLTVGAAGEGSDATHVNVSLPANYVGDTPYLVSGVEERTVRRRLLPTLGGARWDAIAWLQVQGGKTYTYYAARKPAMPVPGDFKGDQATNAWHNGFEDIMVKQYQSLGHAYVGATQGRTRAGTRHLSASEINDALYAFSGISAFAPSGDAATGGRTYIDAHNFYVAYEFGISRMAFATINGAKHVVVEVKVQNALADTFPKVFARDAAIEAIDESAAFRSGTKITFQAVKADGAQDLPEDAVTEVANLNGDAGAASGNTRYFALPYDALKECFRDAPILLRPRAGNDVKLPAPSEAL